MKRVPSAWGSHESEKIKYGDGSHGTRTWEWLCWRGSSSVVNNGPTLIREGGPHQQTPIRLTIMEIWSWAPGRGLTPRQTGRLTVGCNITLALLTVLNIYCSWTGSESNTKLQILQNKVICLEKIFDETYIALMNLSCATKGSQFGAATCWWRIHVSRKWHSEFDL
jgi:hypothetical protein